MGPAGLRGADDPADLAHRRQKTETPGAIPGIGGIQPLQRGENAVHGLLEPLPFAARGRRGYPARPGAEHRDRRLEQRGGAGARNVIQVQPVAMLQDFCNLLYMAPILSLTSSNFDNCPYLHVL